VPPGTYLVGHLELKGDLTFELATGATLQFLGRDQGDYPEKTEILPGPDGDLPLPLGSLITARQADNLTITGGGRIRANGESWWPHPKLYRPRVLLFIQCTNLLVQGITIEDPAFWNTHALYVDQAVFADLTYLRASPAHSVNHTTAASYPSHIWTEGLLHYYYLSGDARALEVGFPLVVRPSYVLGGRAMAIAYSAEELDRFLGDAFAASERQPVLLDRYLRNAIEVDVDALADGTVVVIGGIMQHIEHAGVHSGDSACALPPHSLSPALQDVLRAQTTALARALGVVGLMNVQYAIVREPNAAGVDVDTVYLLEVNPRAARTVPFVAKATGRPLAKIAARVMAGKTLAELGVTSERRPHMTSVKEAVLPFRKFPGVDVMLGPEMKSTGETMGSGPTFAEAYAKALRGAGIHLPLSGRAVLRVDPLDAVQLVPLVAELEALGFVVAAGDITADALQALGLGTARVDPQSRLEGTALVLAAGRGAIHFRRAAVAAKIPCYTTIAGLAAGIHAIALMKAGPLLPRHLGEVQG
jgi:hypothetical protein